MAGFDFRNGYRFDPGTYGNQRAGGLLGLMQEAMAQQALQQHGPGFGSAPNAVGQQNSGAYGDAPPGGLLGRLLALQASQPQQPPVGGGDGQTPPAAPDPNFRQLSRRINIRPLGSPGSSDRPDDQSSPSYYPSADGTSLATPPPPAGQDAGSFGGYGSTPAPMRIADASMMLPSAQGVRGIGIPVPIPSKDPGQIPQIPMPNIPDWWKAIGALLQLYPRITSGLGGGGGENNDDDDCKEEIRKSRQTCVDAFAAGWNGDYSKWKSDYGTGPYSKPGGGRWTIQDCAQGFKSERCGGNPVDWGPKKPKITRYRLTK
jgi:hypothetical protein